MLFSIIIPVFNAERSLEKCLDSIQSQTYGDFEVLMIDDGSTDNSFSICESYAESDPRFRLLHQENSGPSAARNRGLREARGRCICFVDSDDYVLPDYLEKLADKAESSGAEIIFFGYHDVDREGNIKKTNLPPEGLSGAALVFALSERDMFGYTWIKCFSRESIGDVLFPEDMSLFEDEVFTCAVLEKAGSVSVLPAALYCYVSSGMDMLTSRTYEDYCLLSDRVFLVWERLTHSMPGSSDFLQRKANAFVGRCRFYGFERNVDVKRYFSSLTKTRFFQAHTNWETVDRLARNGNWSGVKLCVLAYKAKNILFTFLKKYL